MLAPDLPYAMQLELTSRCNLRCVMCPLTTGTSSTSGRPGPVTEGTWELVLETARRCQQVFIAGYGEPFTNARCVELLRDLDDHGVSTAIATNGLIITERLAAELAALRHLAQVNVSIDSPDADVYRSLRGANLDRALQGVAHLVGALRPDQLTVSSVLMRQNAASLVAFPRLLAELGVVHYDLNGVMDYNDFARSSSLLGEPAMAEVVAAIRSECDEHGVYLVVGGEERLALELADPDAARARFHDRPGADAAVTRQCMVPWEIPFVDKDGGVFACCYAASANERRLGNLHDEPFDAIWRGERFQRFRADLLDGRTAPEICRRCTVAPLGEHPLRAWAAAPVPDSLRHDGRRASFQVRNVGTRTWTQDDLVRVGTRDGTPPIAHPSWLFPQRPATFEEASVAPGEVATFAFDVEPAAEAVTQTFHVVVEGVLWLPDVAVRVRVRAARRTWRRRRGVAVADPARAEGYGGALVGVDRDVDGDGGRVAVRVRNTGTHAWTHGDHVRLGTAEPRDGASPLACESWLAPNRVGTFVEPAVPVGGIATFAFDVAVAPVPTVQALEVVVEGVSWLPDTRVEIPAPVPSPVLGPLSRAG